MQLESACSDGCLCIRYTGDLDHHAARAAFRETEAFIDRFLPRQCILDFSGVSFMDSSGIGLIIGRYKTMRERGGTVIACGLKPPTEKLFRMAGLHRIIAQEDAGRQE